MRSEACIQRTCAALYVAKNPNLFLYLWPWWRECLFKEHKQTNVPKRDFSKVCYRPSHGNKKWEGLTLFRQPKSGIKFTATSRSVRCELEHDERKTDKRELHCR